MFDYIFIGVMGYGIMSAVWATNVGYFAGFLLVLRYFRSEVRSVHFAPVSLGDIKLIFEALSNRMATALSHLTILIRTAVMNAVILAHDRNKDEFLDIHGTSCPFEVLPNEIAFVFGLKDPSGMPMLKVAFRLFALSVPTGGLVYILRAYYQSTGYEKTASVLTLLEGVVFFVPALYMLSRINFTAVWMSFLWLRHLRRV